MKLDPTLLELLETVLPRSVAVMNTLRCLLEQVAVLQEQFGGEHRLAAPRRTRYQQTRRSVELKRFAPFHDLEMIKGLETLRFLSKQLGQWGLDGRDAFHQTQEGDSTIETDGFFLGTTLGRGSLTFREFSHLEFPGVPRFSPLDLGHGSLGRSSLGTLGRRRSPFSRFLREFTQISELVFVPMPLSHSSFPVFFLGKPRHGGRSLAFPASGHSSW